MIRALVLATVLTTAASAAPAQTAQPPAAQEAPLSSPETEFEALALAFGERMEAMEAEIRAAITTTAGDPARQDSELDAIEARYQADADAFAVALETFANGQADLVPEPQKSEMKAGIVAALPRIRSIPQEVRAALEQAAALPAPAGS